MAAVDFLGAAGAGSDIDSKALVTSLVAAERAPKESSINSKISKSEIQISGYGRVLTELGNLSAAFNTLNDALEFSDHTVNINGALASDGSPAYSVVATANVVAGITEVEVTSVATQDRWLSDAGFAAGTTALNGGSGFSIGVVQGSTTTSVAVATATPQGVVDAINATSLGITASLVDTGSASNPYKILIEGGLGSGNAFSLTDTSSAGTQLNMSVRLSTASNSEIEINGVAIERSSNIIADAVTGMTLTLSAPTASVSRISVEQDKTGVEDRIRNLVAVYNTANENFRALTNKEAEDELAGVFSGNSTFRSITSTVQKLFTEKSSTETTNISYLSDLGVMINRYGDLEIDDDELTAALTDHFDEVITMFSADTDNQTIYGTVDRGLAGDAVQTLTDLMSTDGMIMVQNASLSSKISDYEDDLKDLDRRMSQIYERYLAQFTAMEMAIDQMNATKEYLTSALEGLPFNNKNS